jgi:hypothetical protein
MLSQNSVVRLINQRIDKILNIYVFQSPIYPSILAPKFTHIDDYLLNSYLGLG